MTIDIFIGIMLIVGCVTGFIGALTGLGGGIIITPLLILFFPVDVHEAMATSLVSVMMLSSSSTIPYLKAGYTNIRIGMFLATGTVVGAIIGKLLLPVVSIRWIMILFSIILLLSAYFVLNNRTGKSRHLPSHSWARTLQLEGYYKVDERWQFYGVQRVPVTLLLMGLSGILSTLLGLGGGIIQVLAMDRIMGLPYKVATATSNFIIGITAIVGISIYFLAGYINPILTFPIMIGIFIGANLGAKILKSANIQLLRIIFSGLIFYIALHLLYKGISGV